MIDLKVGLDVGDGRMVHRYEDEVNGSRKAVNLSLQPSGLIGAGHQRRVTVVGNDIDARGSVAKFAAGLLVG